MKSLHARIRLFDRRHPRLAHVVQVALLIAFCLLGKAVAQALQLPVPGSVLALGLVLLLLATRIVPAAGLRRGADWLLAEMLLFFIPAVMAVSQHMPVLRHAGARILAVILLGTVVVMGATALLVDRVWRWEQRRAG